MSEKSSLKIDKFFLLYVTVLIVLSGLLVFSIQNILTSFLTAYEVDQALLQKEKTVDTGKLNEAFSFVYDKEPVPLKLQ